MKEPDDRELEILKGIQEKVNEHVKRNPTKVVPFKKEYPAIAFLVEKALESDDIPEENKEKLRNLAEVGYFNKKYEKEDKVSIRAREHKWAEEVAKEVIMGRLEKPKNKLVDKYLKKYGYKAPNGDKGGDSKESSGKGD
jgi:hypothetical protein